MSNLSTSQIVSRLSNVVRIDTASIQSDAIEALEQALLIAFTYKGHRCNSDPLHRVLEKIKGVKSAKSRALQPIISHFIGQSDSIRANAKTSPEREDVAQLIADGIAEYSTALAAFETAQAEKSAASSAKAQATKAAKAEAAKAEAAKAESALIESAKAEAAGKLSETEKALADALAENAALRGKLEAIAAAGNIKEVRAILAG